ncbi:MAG: SPOR domain-containing protein [Emcibacteraceae bacterium]
MQRFKHIIIKFFIPLFLVLILFGCSTIDGFLGGGMNDPENVAAANAEKENGQMATPEPAEPAMPTVEEQLAEKDKALVNQGMRIAATERELQMIQEENSSLKAELNALKAEADETKAMLEQANESQVAAASENARSNAPRPKAPNGGYGLHLASYLHMESIEPGLKNLEAKIPVLIEGKPIKIAKATVKGQNYNRLIVGKFDNRDDAQAECRQALLLISFCEVVAFDGEDY